MAKLYGEIAKSALLTLDKSFSRALGQPLDASEVYYSLEAAKTYAADPQSKAYIGQKIVVIEDGKVTHYSIEDAAGTLKELGSKPVGDNKSITVDANGIVGILGAAEADSLTLPRMKADKSGIEWVPVSQVVEGDGNDNTTYEITALKKGEGDAAETYGIKVKTLFNDTAVEGGEFEIGFDVYTKSEADAKFLAKADYTPYDETALKNRVKAIEDDYLKAEDKYDDTALAARVKALEDEERYDETPLANRVTSLETAVNNEDTGLAAHETRIAKVEEFFALADGESLDQALDTLVEIQKYIDEDGKVAEQVLANKTAIETLNGDATKAGSVDKKIADAIAPLATTEALNGVKTTAEAAQTAQEVSDAIDAKITAQNLGQYAKSADVTETLKDYAKSADVVSNDTFEQFKTDNTAAIGEKANASEVYKKGETYSQTEVNNLIADFVVEGDITAAVEAEAEIARAAEKANADAIKAISDDYLDSEDKTELSDAINLKASKTELSTEINTLKTGVIATAQTQADKGVTDAATAKQRADEAYNLADSNKTNHTALAGVVDSHTSTIGEHSTKLTSLETTVSGHSGKLTTLEGQITDKADKTALEALSKTVSGNSGNITDLTTRVGANETAIGNINTKFADYYKKTETYSQSEVDDLIKDFATDAEVEAAVKAEADRAKLAEKANADALATLIGSDADVSVRTIAADEINTLIGGVSDADTITNITTLIEYVNENGGDVTGMKTDIDNLQDIVAGIGGTDQPATVLELVEQKIAAIPLANLVEGEDGVVTATQGLILPENEKFEMAAGKVTAISTDLLVQGKNTLILFGGSASV